MASSGTATVAVQVCDDASHICQDMYTRSKTSTWLAIVRVNVKFGKARMGTTTSAAVVDLDYHNLDLQVGP